MSSRGKEIAEEIAREIIDVQPMPPDLFKNMLASATPREQLIKEGFKPVSRMGLLWIKE